MESKDNIPNWWEAWIEFASQDSSDNPNKQYFFKKGFEACLKIMTRKKKETE